MSVFSGGGIGTVGPMTTALITGATAGIGAAFAVKLARAGHNVVLVARDTERLSEYAEKLSAEYGVETEALTADLATDAGIAAVEERLADPARPVDLLINNAGFGNKGAFLAVPLQAELDMQKVHIEAVLRLTAAALPGMRERRLGGVVNVASVAAFLPRGTYGASKAWVVSFTQGVARDLGDSGVRMMALCPGFTRTEFHQRAGMGTSDIPSWGWLSAERVVNEAMRDFARGRSLSVPGKRYKAAVAVARLLPSGALGGVSSKAARTYGKE
ncbi:dehydrogenase [Kitasatospora indigofera]|uniref:Dehydrogenase n=2 Tax=Kitasatospora indigofera TaxID=67307 RepID=A0A919FEL3_9ACTN|nr:dehydrogenase [Kitasatospora indigofera]